MGNQLISSAAWALFDWGGGSPTSNMQSHRFPHLTYLCDGQGVNHMIESAALLLGACYVSALRHFQSTKRWSLSLDGISERYGRCQGACEKACGILAR